MLSFKHLYSIILLISLIDDISIAEEHFGQIVHNSAINSSSVVSGVQGGASSELFSFFIF